MDKKEDNEFTYECEFTKVEENPDGNIIIAGIATTDSKDHDDEIVDADAVKTAWADYNGSIRYMHGKAEHNKAAVGVVIPSHTDSSGKVWRTEFTEQGPFIVAKISNAPDTESIRTKVNEGVIRGFSIGGRCRRIKTFDPTLQKDITHVITTRISEISLVDLPANKASYFEVLKAACTGPNCPINAGTEPIEIEDDPIVEQAVAKFEQIIADNAKMVDDIERLELEIRAMTNANDPDMIIKGEENESTGTDENNISTITKDIAEVDDQIGGTNMENEDGIVRMEIPELEDFIKGCVENMVSEQETVEKLDDYDRLLKEATDMRRRIEELESKVTAQAKSLANQKPQVMKSEDETEAVEKAAKKKEEAPKFDDEGNEIIDEGMKEKKDMKDKMDKLEATIEELKSSPLYKAEMAGEVVEKDEATPASTLLGGIISAHYGGK